MHFRVFGAFAVVFRGYRAFKVVFTVFNSREFKVVFRLFRAFEAFFCPWGPVCRPLESGFSWPWPSAVGVQAWR